MRIFQRLKLALLSLAVLVPLQAGTADADSLGQTKNVRATYTGSALRLPIFKLIIELETRDGPFRAGIRSFTTGVGRIKQFSYEALASGQVQGATLSPNLFQQIESSTKRGQLKERSLSIRFDGQQRPTVTYNPVPNLRDGEAVSPEQGKGAYDPASFFAALSRHFMATQSCNAKGRLYDGRSMIQLSIHHQGKDQLAGPLYSGSADYCLVYPKPVQGKATRPGQADFYEPFDIWIAKPLAGGPVLPVKIRTTFFVIPTTLELTSLTEIP